MRSAWIGGSLICLALAAPASAGEEPHLLADVNPLPASPGSVLDLSAEPAAFFELGGRLLFSTVSRSNEDEGILWSTDGTAAGTVQVSSSLCAYPCGGISVLGIWRNLAFLRTSPGSESAQIWRTDGTAAGTFLLRDPNGRPETVFSDLYSSPGLDAVYFTGYDLDVGYQLWLSDGTSKGTRPLLGADGVSFHYPSSFTAWNGRLYFVADREEPAEHPGFGLWSTDGTPAGTRFVAGASVGTRIVATASSLFFNAGPSGEDLWAADGTPGGARRILDLDPPGCIPPPDSECDDPDILSMAAFGDALYFRTLRSGHGPEIWRSDGTETGTRPAIELPASAGRIEDLRRIGDRWLFTSGPGNGAPGVLWTADGGLTQAAPLTGCDAGTCPAVSFSLDDTGNGRWIFVSYDPVHGSEPWVTDGTGPGTRLLADTCPGACSGITADANPLASVTSSPYGGIYFRSVSETDESDSLWITDGTPEGTRRVTGHSSGLGFLGGRAWFGRLNLETPALELWSTDGTRAGTRSSVVLRTYSAGSSPVFLPSGAGARFLADEGGGVHRLWTSDGTPEGTSELRGFALSSPRDPGAAIFTRAGGLTFFDVARQSNSGKYVYELWRTDGTPAGTRGILALGQRSISEVRAVRGDRLLFSVIEIHGCSLWTSDGTEAGTRQLLPALPGVRCPTVLAPLSASSLLFVARIETPRDPVPQVFVTDGTVAGTRRITALHGTRDPLDDQAVELGGTVFFRINGLNGVGPELWRSDGTPEGTRRVDDLNGVSQTYAFQGNLYCIAYSSSLGDQALVRLPPDGPPQLLGEVEWPADGEQPVSFASAGDRLLFTGQDQEHGTELWVTDGTPAGTHLLSDLQPGLGSSSPDGLTSAGDRVFFSADDGTHGRELWESDGTPEGTRMVADLAPGGFSSILFGQTALAVSNGYLFFAADDGKTGVEPWALRLEP